MRGKMCEKETRERSSGWSRHDACEGPSAQIESAFPFPGVSQSGRTHQLVETLETEILRNYPEIVTAAIDPSR